ncbi:hypothetical protein [Halomarina pelagica]|uniref:hypothetical protein n=1 Tax=Halomarina pelagica TaxID=2961599 RepID=UPI0020C45D10|nr:hypothetical protein [Halomarina sp. BND7]
MHVPRRRLLALAGTLALAGCGDRGDRGDRERRRTDPPSAVTPAGTSDDLAYTHVRPSGNRVLDGTGSVPDATPRAVPFDGTPAWLVAAPTERGSLWVVVADDGRARGFEVRGGDRRDRAVSPARLDPGTPPALALDGGEPTLLVPPEGASALGHPVRLEGGALLFVADGDLVRRDADAEVRLPIDALPDARIVQSGDVVAVLAGATDRYDHGVLGDGTEAGSVAVVDASEGLELRTRIEVGPPAVVEGIASILADVTGDGRPDVIVTESDADRGARVAAYAADGTRLAAGEPIGTGFRWRHQLAVAPFAPDAVPELAVVRTPHVGGVAEFYRARGDRLSVVATAERYGTHIIGSRNLDGALAGDFDGDGRIELLLPTGDRTALAALRRTGDGVREAWTLPVGGAVRTNLAGVRGGDGRIVVGVGTDDGLRLWG